jgi:hypothetical protein
MDKLLLDTNIVSYVKWRCVLKAIRIRKDLDAPIPQLPELAPMMCKSVEMIVFETDGVPVGANEPGKGDAAAALSPAPGSGARPVQSLDELRSREPGDPFGEEFERTLAEWRRF